MATNRRILCVDDEPNILEALERVLGERFDLVTASDPAAALRLLEGGAFAVVVSDMRMPTMSGTELLRRTRESAPLTTRVLLTGQSDLAMASAAVNDGGVFRFLVKPCPSESMVSALESAIEHHYVSTAERELLERTLTSMVKLLTDVLAMASPAVFQRSKRMQRYVVHIANALSLADPWQYEVAASLSLLGCMALPDDLLEKVATGRKLTPAEHAVYATHPEIAHRLLVGIPRLGAVAAIIHAQRAQGSGVAPGAAAGARILRVAAELDALVQQGLGLAEAHAALMARSHADDRPYVATLATLTDTFASGGARALKLDELRSGMVFDEDVRAQSGTILARSGTEISTMLLERLRRFSAGAGIIQPIQVKNAA